MSMIASAKPRKQRRFRYTAPMHERQKFAHAHIAKELAKKLGIKKRSIAVRKGDTVKVMSGDSKGKTGKVTNVDLRRSTLLMEGVTRKNAKGKEIQMPVHVSKVYITDLDLADKLRTAAINKSKM